MMTITNRTAHGRRSRRSIARSPRGSAFTLIEALCSVALGGAVAVSAAVITVQSVAIRRAAVHNLTERWQRVRVFDQFEADVRAALTWADAPSGVITFPDAPRRLMEVTCLSAVNRIGSLSQTRMPARVAYVLSESDTRTGPMKLVREALDLTQTPPVPSARTLADGLSACRVETYNGAEWNAAPGGRHDDKRPPVAVRLICHWADHPNATDVRTVILRAMGSHGRN